MVRTAPGLNGVRCVSPTSAPGPTNRKVTRASPALLEFTALNTPAGSVQFKDGAQDLGAPVPLAGGVATLRTKLAGGDHALSAVYAGDGGFDASVSGTVDHVVACPPPQSPGKPPCGT